MYRIGEHHVQVPSSDAANMMNHLVLIKDTIKRKLFCSFPSLNRYKTHVAHEQTKEDSPTITTVSISIADAPHSPRRPTMRVTAVTSTPASSGSSVIRIASVVIAGRSDGWRRARAGGP